MAASERLVRESRGGPVPREVREIDAEASRLADSLSERPYVLLRAAAERVGEGGSCLGSIVVAVRVFPREGQRPTIRGSRFAAPLVLYDDVPCPVSAPPEAFQAAALACAARAMERLSAVLIAGRNLPAPPPAAR